jgi:hypothetical protein
VFVCWDIATARACQPATAVNKHGESAPVLYPEYPKALQTVAEGDGVIIPPLFAVASECVVSCGHFVRDMRFPLVGQL